MGEGKTEMKFKPGDRVIVTNIDGNYENNNPLLGIGIKGIGEKGIVLYYSTSAWPVEVEMDNGEQYSYSESELELEELKDNS
jgi:hypothetical protein